VKESGGTNRRKQMQLIRRMDPQQKLNTSPAAMIGSLWRHRYLVWQMTMRDLVVRYRGTFAGIVWSFFQPLLMLIVYTFVFSTVFKSQWHGTTEESKASFALVLFSGLIVFGLFSECANRAPGIVLGQVNYVKKIVFPLEVLPWIVMGSALFQTLINIGLLLGAYAILNGEAHLRAMWVPVVVFPLVLGTMGVMWFLASLGVFVRDVAHAMQPITMMLLFLSPIFYPVSALPPEYQFWLLLNPLTYFVEDFRNVLLWDRSPDWSMWSASMAAGFLVAWAGFWWFQRTRRGFADVL
jgi:lipopolysaccharide transport system permease protein